MFTTTHVFAIAIAAIIVGVIVGFYVGASVMRQWFCQYE